MTTFSLPPEWLDLLLQAMDGLQHGLRQALHLLGLADSVHGEPAWPFRQRLAAEMLLIDNGLVRSLCLALAGTLLAGLLLLLSLRWKAARPWLWMATAALLLVLPWPAQHLLMTPAVPTSLHSSPTGFRADSILAGQAVYQQHCLRCHGADGRGEGPDAAALAMWPPMFDAGLLWKRLDGELFWRVRHGMQAADGSSSMPGFALELDDADTWAVLDYTRALGAGQSLRSAGAWTYPIQVPDAPVSCRDGRRGSLRSLSEQRLRLVLAAPGSDQGVLPAEHPLLTNVLIGAGLSSNQTSVAAECRIDDAAAAAALALILGVEPDTGAGHQLLTDSTGWLRAYSPPGQENWSTDDLVCKPGSNNTGPLSAAAPAARSDGLTDLLLRMDEQPIQLRRGGIPH